MTNPSLDFTVPPGGGAVRACYGPEFCQSLLPSASQLQDARAALRGVAGFTLVTPPVTDHGLRRVETLLDALGEGEGVEVVVNDWGVLGLVAKRPWLEPVLGRLLTRMLRDPRFPPDAVGTKVTGDALRAVRQSGVTSPPFRALLRARGVRRVEVDATIQGVDLDFDALELQPTLHAPWGYVTTGRVCLFAAMEQPREKRFEAGGACHQECRRYTATMADTTAERPDVALVTAGNTVFQRHTRATLEAALPLLSARGGRLVVRREPFDELAWATEDPSVARAWLEEHTR